MKQAEKSGSESTLLRVINDPVAPKQKAKGGVDQKPHFQSYSNLIKDKTEPVSRAGPTLETFRSGVLVPPSFNGIRFALENQISLVHECSQ
jgi:hypothetical protein